MLSTSQPSAQVHTTPSLEQTGVHMFKSSPTCCLLFVHTISRLHLTFCIHATVHTLNSCLPFFPLHGHLTEGTCTQNPHRNYDRLSSNTTSKWTYPLPPALKVYIVIWTPQERLKLMLYNRGYARPPVWFCVEREPVI